MTPEDYEALQDALKITPRTHMAPEMWQTSIATVHDISKEDRRRRKKEKEERKKIVADIHLKSKKEEVEETKLRKEQNAEAESGEFDYGKALMGYQARQGKS